MKTSLTIFNIITSAYSKTLNSLEFNPISQKFCEVICEIIFSKTVFEIFLILCRSRFINDFVGEKQFFGTVKS